MIWMLTHYSPQQSTVIVRATTETAARRLAADMMHNPAWVRVWMDSARSECLPLDPDDFECHFITRLAVKMPIETPKEKLDA